MQQPISTVLKIKNKDLSRTHQSMAGLNGIVFSLDKEEESSAVFPEMHTSKRPSANTVAKPFDEIDLHIEVLNANHLQLTPQAMLHTQMQYFSKNLEAAIVHNMEKIIFIHGVGAGVLGAVTRGGAVGVVIGRGH